MAITSVNNINYVDFAKVNSIQMKQGDKTPIAIKLQQVNNSIRRNANISEQESKATVYLSDTKTRKVIYKEDFEVKLGTVTLIINSVLPTGLYSLEIDYNGKKYPSDNSFSIVINHSATVAPEEIKSLDTIEMVQESVLVSVIPKVQSFVDAKLSTEVAKYVNANKTMLKGDKGDKGDKGTQAEQGIQGIQGVKGDKGSQGIQGVKGDKGDKGDTTYLPPKIYTRDEYNQLATKDNNTLYFISEV